MKVTTDACIFGAMIDLSGAESILDIGAGTGLLSLMAAQRTDAKITSIELDRVAVEQAEVNINNSPWSDQINLIHDSIQNYSRSSQTRFDCIFSNPPFFHNSMKAPESKRNMARHTDNLSFDELAKAINSLMSDNGQAWIILPIDSSKQFIHSASRMDLKLNMMTAIRSSNEHPPHRHVMVISRKSQIEKEKVLTIYHQHPEYTPEVRSLMKPYYLYL